ncbi:hypothetical protein [Plantactinospora endophytica]|uniref:Mce-associated membrane protein n=1 Tax=Plantactinospora endophytica TaxID=673535 RepID=A0ABQ4DYC8_9ACTN|nr:hypothetical protein [Plantactinospora endophytica]GIG87091.1 hypothetical protein Pen02_20270 [Plantactinospora endophytica]
MRSGAERRLKLVKDTSTTTDQTGTDQDRQPPAEPPDAAAGVRRPTDGTRQPPDATTDRMRHSTDGARQPTDRTRHSTDGARHSGRGGRPATRRTVTRRLPAAKDPVEAILERLDQETDGTDQEADGTDQASDDEPGTDRADEAGSNAVRADEAGSSADETTANRATANGPTVPGRRRGVTVALVAVLCAVLALAGLFGYRWWQDRAVERAHGQALAAARQTTVNFVSVSASSVDSDLQRITAGATGEFREEFVRGQAKVRAAVLENKVESRGTVLRAGLVSGDRRHAVVLVAMDATVKNVNAPDGRPAHYRIQVDLTREDDSDTWLVSRLQFVG